MIRGHRQEQYFYGGKDDSELRARISPVRLYTFDRLGDGECELSEIVAITEAPLIGGRALVAAQVPGMERSPAARFEHPDEARRFSRRLTEALERVYMEEAGMQANRMNGVSEFFGDPIHVYTREEAKQDGVLVDVTGTAREAGFKVDTAITAALDADISDLSSPLLDGGESHKGRLWDVLVTGHLAAHKSGLPALAYTLHMPVGDKKLYEVKAVIGPGDDEDPVLTLMRTDED
ncbi:DUF6573 family protein [Rubrobacter aplysinae]|uniref:DUF6573 family protein n=1 Tax=Rubrobacter aplysinae TaxID=909625 RepID=UPI00069D0DC8|nr:DUF6573 family protein [Rubrobacter aplysinae]